MIELLSYLDQLLYQYQWMQAMEAWWRDVVGYYQKVNADAQSCHSKLAGTRTGSQS